MMSTFHINVTTGTGTPIYRQIIEQVRLGCGHGRLGPRRGHAQRAELG